MELLRRLLPQRAWIWTAVAASLWLAARVPGAAQGPVTSVQEYQLKAAFLYNFVKFVEWPAAAADSKDPLVIVVFGRDPFGPALENVVWGKTINNRPLKVRRTGRIEELLPCHVAFVSVRERRHASELVKVAEQAGVLTVSELDDFLELGGVVKLVTESNKVRFEINLEAAKRGGLRISSRLLSLARLVTN